MNSLRGRITNRQVTQRFVQRLQSLKLRSSSTATSDVSDFSLNKTEIDIPFRIERSSTDILSALEKTITRDLTAAHYKYHDDPLLIPQSNRSKRAFALSKESGRKAAMWILQEHSTLFNHRIAEPEVKAFLPKAKYEKREEVSEELLLSVIKGGSVVDAMAIYKLMANEISIECKQALLELLCFYNSQDDQLPDDLTEERWYRRAAKRQRQLWKSSREVNELFEYLKKQDKPIAAAAYNAMICGTAKYTNVDTAWALFEECEQNNIPLSLVTYNSVIPLVSIMRDGVEEQRVLLLDTLGKIVQAGLSPNLATLNSALRVVSLMNRQHVAKNLVRSLFREFKKLGIQPSLGSYYFVLVVFCKDRGITSSVLRNIIAELEGKTFTMQDPSDIFFFVTAMDVAKNHLHDRELGQKIHKLLLTGNNYKLIGEGFKESIYYRHYMTLMLKSLPFEEFMQLYDLMVPNIYIPEPSVMEEILNTLELIESTIARDVLSRLWSNMVMFEHLERENLLTKAFNLMRIHCSPPEDSPINAQYAEAAGTYWNYIKDQTSYRSHGLSLQAKILGDIAILSVRGDEFERFLEIIAMMVKDYNSIIGTMDIEQLNIAFDACLERGHAPGALTVLRYSVQSGFEVSTSFAQKIQANIPLTAEQELEIGNFIESELSKTNKSNEENEQTADRASTVN